MNTKKNVINITRSNKITAIEEIYKAYGVDKQRVIDCCTTEEYFECEDKHNCVNCDKCIHFEYPPFTAEKQLELLKLVSNYKVFELVKQNKYSSWFMCASIGCDDYHEARDIDFTQALAKLVIALKDKLDHNKVKEILE